MTRPKPLPRPSLSLLLKKKIADLRPSVEYVKWSGKSFKVVSRHPGGQIEIIIDAFNGKTKIVPEIETCSPSSGLYANSTKTIGERMGLRRRLRLRTA